MCPVKLRIRRNRRKLVLKLLHLNITRDTHVYNEPRGILIWLSFLTYRVEGTVAISKPSASTISVQGGY